MTRKQTGKGAGASSMQKRARAPPDATAAIMRAHCPPPARPPPARPPPHTDPAAASAAAAAATARNYAAARNYASQRSAETTARKNVGKGKKKTL